RNDPRQLQHVVKLPRKGDGRICPLRAVAQVDLLVALQQFHHLGVRRLTLLVVADHGAVRGHHFAEFAPQQERILIAVGFHQHGIDFLLALALGVEVSIAGRGLQILRVLHGARASDESAEDARYQRVRTQPVGAVILVFTLASGVDSRDVGGLLVIDPETAHGVVHARENLHGNFARIVADKLLVDFQDAFQFAVESLGVDVGEVEINHRLAIDAEVFLVHHFENRARGHVAWNEVTVFRIPLFEEVPALFLRNGLGIAWVVRSPGNPDAAAFAARRLRHQAQLVFSGNRCRVNLNELAVGVVAALLIKRGLRRPGTHHRIGGLAEDGANAARADDDGVGREGANFHRPQIHRADAAANALPVKHGREKLPVFVLLDLAFGLVAADLLVERVEKLLTGGCSGEGGAVKKRAAEAAEIEQSFGRAIEGNADAIEQIDDAGSSLAHGLDRRLVGEKVATVDGVVEMDPGGIAFAFQVLGGVNATLRANRVRALDWYDREQVNLTAHFGDLDNGGEACEASAHYDNFRSCHFYESDLLPIWFPGRARACMTSAAKAAIKFAALTARLNPRPFKARFNQLFPQPLSHHDIFRTRT